MGCRLEFLRSAELLKVSAFLPSRWVGLGGLHVPSTLVPVVKCGDLVQSNGFLFLWWKSVLVSSPWKCLFGWLREGSIMLYFGLPSEALLCFMSAQILLLERSYNLIAASTYVIHSK